MNNSRSTKISVGMFYQIQSDIRDTKSLDNKKLIFFGRLLNVFLSFFLGGEGGVVFLSFFNAFIDAFSTVSFYFINMMCILTICVELVRKPLSTFVRN